MPQESALCESLGRGGAGAASTGAIPEARFCADELYADSALGAATDVAGIAMDAGIGTGVGTSAVRSCGTSSSDSGAKLAPNSKPVSAVTCARAALKME